MDMGLMLDEVALLRQAEELEEWGSTAGAARIACPAPGQPRSPSPAPPAPAPAPARLNLCLPPTRPPPLLIFAPATCHRPNHLPPAPAGLRPDHLPPPRPPGSAWLGRSDGHH
ncbi:hypothetical protein GCM10027269_51610 [Kribbella endophytica]